MIGLKVLGVAYENSLSPLSYTVCAKLIIISDYGHSTVILAK